MLACAWAAAVGGCAGGVPALPPRAPGPSDAPPPATVRAATVRAAEEPAGPSTRWRRTAASRDEPTAVPRWEPAGPVDPGDAASARILAARDGGGGADADGLGAIVRDGLRPEPLRAAAAEAWVSALAAGGSDGASPETIFAPAGRMLADGGVPPAVRAELLRGLSVHLAPARFAAVDGWGAAGVSGGTASPELRRAVVEAAILHAAARGGRVPESHLPAPLREAAFDPDSGVRRLVCRYLATAAPPDAVGRLVDRLADAEPSVRRAAVAALGELHRSARHAARAREELRLAAESGGEPLREAVVRACAAWGPGEVRRFRIDESAAVRSAAAEALAHAEPAEAAVAVLSEFLADADPGVQSAAVSATAGRPDRFALPVLLVALRDAALPARRAALAEVRRRTGRRDPFPLAEDRPARTAAVNRWSAELAAPVGPPPAWFAGLGASGGTPTGGESTADATPGLDAGTVPPDGAGDAPPTASGESAVTAPLPPVLAAALAGLESDSVHERRAAAAAIAAHAAAGPPGGEVGARVAEHLGGESDRTVWRTLADVPLRADAADAVTLAALHHGFVDVRRLGCERVGSRVTRGGGPAPVAWVLPLLDDPEPAVRIAAAGAVAACGHPAGLSGLGPQKPGLTALADDPDPAVRAAALDARAHLGDPAAVAELTRELIAADAAARPAVLGRITRTGRAEFTPHLLRLGWTERDPHVRAALLTALDRLAAPADRPPAGAADARSLNARSANAGSLDARSPGGGADGGGSGGGDRLSAWVSWWAARGEFRPRAEPLHSGSDRPGHVDGA